MQRVDICVITCLRPRGLERLLRAIQQLRTPADCELRVVVVDNDAGGSALEVCARAQAERWLRCPLLYATEKRRGIPQARNAALARSLREADFVAFIDDDEVPDRDWMAELLDARERYAADAVTGPVEPLFEAPAPAWASDCGLFGNPHHATGTVLGCAYTNNVLVSCRALAEMDGLFNERMALIGSSDSEFFERFATRGHRIVWCETARTNEWVPASRARVRWLMRRAFRVGASQAFIHRLRSAPAHSAARLAAHGVWCIGKGALLALLGLPRGRRGVVWGAYLAFAGAGRLVGLCGWSYPEYRTLHGR